MEYIETMITRDAIASKYGRSAIYRVLLETDPEFQEALRIMKESRTLADMFKYAEEQNSIKKASVE